MRIFVLKVMRVYLIDQYQNATARAMPLHELKKVQLQECFTLMTQDLIGCLKPFLHERFIAEQRHGVLMETLQLSELMSSLLSIEKMLSIRV